MVRYFIFSIVIASIIALSYGLFNEKENLLIENQEYKKNVFTHYKEGEIVKGDTVSAVIKAQENNLGIIGIGFNTFGQVRNDIFIFRIKEEGSREWYYTNTYKAKEFGGFKFFPFGFPIINNSKDKNYIIELESQAGREGSAVAIAKEEPTIVARYKFNRSEVLANKSLLIKIASKKISSIIQAKSTQYIFFEIFFITIISFFSIHYLKIKRKKLSKSAKKIISKHKLKRGFENMYIVIRPFRIALEVLGHLFLLVVKLVGYFYNWLGKE